MSRELFCFDYRDHCRVSIVVIFGAILSFDVYELSRCCEIFQWVWLLLLMAIFHMTRTHNLSTFKTLFDPGCFHK